MLRRHFHDDHEGSQRRLGDTGEIAAHPEYRERRCGGLTRRVGHDLPEARAD
jgi:hypothetical protein